MSVLAVTHYSPHFRKLQIIFKNFNFIWFWTHYSSQQTTFSLCCVAAWGTKLPSQIKFTEKHIYIKWFREKRTVWALYNQDKPSNHLIIFNDSISRLRKSLWISCHFDIENYIRLDIVFLVWFFGTFYPKICIEKCLKQSST